MGCTMTARYGIIPIQKRDSIVPGVVRVPADAPEAANCGFHAGMPFSGAISPDRGRLVRPVGSRVICDQSNHSDTLTEVG
jgi:hypothetical protein